MTNARIDYTKVMKLQYSYLVIDEERQEGSEAFPLQETVYTHLQTCNTFLPRSENRRSIGRYFVGTPSKGRRSRDTECPPRRGLRWHSPLRTNSPRESITRSRWIFRDVRASEYKPSRGKDEEKYSSVSSDRQARWTRHALEDGGPWERDGWNTNEGRCWRNHVYRGRRHRYSPT